jgi:tetratricopeptide (TPR) repeat protein
MSKRINPIAFFLTVLFLFLAAYCYGQDKEVNRFSNRIESIAKEYYRIKDYKRALEGYLMLDSLHPGTTELNYRIGICYLNSSRKSKAYPYLEFAYNQEDAPQDILRELARAYHFGMEFEKAIIGYESYRKQIQFVNSNTKYTTDQIEQVDRNIQMCRNGLRLIHQPLLNTSVINMGAEVNSEYTDFAPLINKDEDLLIFTSKRKVTENTKSDPLTGQYFESILYSNKAASGWTEAKNIGPPINQDNIHNSAVGLSPDGNLLFLYQGDNNSFSARIAGDLYMSVTEGSKWSEPKIIRTVNSKSRESSASISEDKSKLIFSSDRDGGFGGTDLYISRKKINGDWTLPENLGGYINTKFDEDGPFIHPDGNKLYFSSKGHNSMGGYDIFYSEFLENKNRWTRPVNMGYPVNSPDNDIFFVWSKDGERAYFSSEREDTYGDTDIYTFIRNDTDNILIETSGIISDKVDQSPVKAEIFVRDQWSNNLIGIFGSESKSGSYSIKLKSGRKYIFTIKSEGYVDVSEQRDIPQQPENKDLIKNVTLTRKK